jgi:hypothetical protein
LQNFFREFINKQNFGIDFVQETLIKIGAGSGSINFKEANVSITDVHL